MKRPLAGVEAASEHEADTAQRPWPKELADSVRAQLAAQRAEAQKHQQFEAQATAKLPAVDLDTMLRRESGTRAAVTAAQIAGHLAEATHLPPVGAPQFDIPIDVDFAAIDAHARQARMRRRVIIAVVAALFVVSSVLAFVAGRLSAG